MKFHEWWTDEIGHPPADEQDRRIFGFALRAWRAALAYGEHEVRPDEVEQALKRVGAGESTHDDELTLRSRILVADEAALALEAELGAFESLAQQMDEAERRAAETPGPVPAGGLPMGGTRWRCPRCRFIGGLRKVEHECRGCGYPGQDTRDWVKQEDSGPQAPWEDDGQARDP